MKYRLKGDLVVLLDLLDDQLLQLIAKNKVCNIYLVLPQCEISFFLDLQLVESLNFGSVVFFHLW